MKHWFTLVHYNRKTEKSVTPNPPHDSQNWIGKILTIFSHKTHNLKWYLFLKLHNSQCIVCSSLSLLGCILVHFGIPGQCHKIHRLAYLKDNLCSNPHISLGDTDQMISQITIPQVSLAIHYELHNISRVLLVRFVLQAAKVHGYRPVVCELEGESFHLPHFSSHPWECSKGSWI